MKRCRICRTEKPLPEFHRDRSRRDGLQTICKACVHERDVERYWRDHAPPVGLTPEERLARARASRRAWYYGNREHARQRVKARIAALRDWIRTRRARASCGVCGEVESCCLDFHHRNPAEKEVDVARAVRARGWSIERLEAEIAKCAVLCANCHRKVHAGLLTLAS